MVTIAGAVRPGVFHAVPSQARAPADPGRLGPSRGGGGRQCPGPGRPAELAAAAGRLPAHPGAHRGPPRRPAGGPDGQFRGRPHEHRRRAHRLPGPDPGGRRHRGRQFQHQPRVAGGVRRRRRGGRHPAPVRPALAGRRAQPPGAPVRHARAGGRAGRAGRGGACLPGRARYPAAFGRGEPAQAAGAVREGEGRPHRHRQRPLLRHGSRQALGPCRARLPGHHRGDGAVPLRRCAGGTARSLRARRGRRVRHADRGRGRRPLPRRRRRGVHEFPRRSRARAD